jgi:hypothetical protein
MRHFDRPFSLPIMLLCLLMMGSAASRASVDTKPATTWWPDPITGLMWTGTAPYVFVNWKQANDSCGALRLGGFSDWRLPTLDEVRAATRFTYVVPEPGIAAAPPPIKHSAIPRQPEDPFPPRPYAALVFRGGIDVREQNAIWTSTPDGEGSVRVVFMGEPRAFWGGGDIHFRSSKVTEHLVHTWVCTRAMGPDLLQIAKDAQVSNPVPDLLTLQADVPLNKAKVAYKAGQFEESLAQARGALAIKPDLAAGDWAIGISYGRLRQWGEAIASFEAALKIDKNYGDAKTGLKWAKESQEAAQKGMAIKTMTPQWN